MVDNSMLVTRNMREGMYFMGLQVLRATGEIGTIEPEFSHDGLRIRHTMHKVTTLEYTSCCIGCGNTFLNPRKWNALSSEWQVRNLIENRKAPKHAKRFICAKAGSPKSRETHGDGNLIVIGQGQRRT